MTQNRIRQLRQEKGLTVEVLAERLGISHGHLSRIERQARGLSIELAREVAKAMNVTVAEVLGIDTQANGQARADERLCEDAVPFVPSASTPTIPTYPGNVAPWVMKTDALDKVGMPAGTIVFVDTSAEAVDNVRPLQCVIAHIYDDKEMTRAVTVARQFVPPSLLITNSSMRNAMPLDLDKSEAIIKGVIVGHYHVAP
jgi:transcriptional regulator with XRE-family HTH domain